MKIVNFHEISDSKWFCSALQMLEKDYDIVDFEAVKNYYLGSNSGKNQVHITVDDGHETTYGVIYQELKKRGLSASIFVSPELLINRENFWFEEIKGFDENKLKQLIAEECQLSVEEIQNYHHLLLFKSLPIDTIWKIIKRYQKEERIKPKTCQYITIEQLLEMEYSGIIHIGAHTQHHPILANESRQRCEKEIVGSIDLLSEVLHRPVTTFAYPNGMPMLDFGKREKEILKQTTVEYAFSFENKDCHSKRDNVLEIPRYGLSHGSEFYMRSFLKWKPMVYRLKTFFSLTDEKIRMGLNKKLKQKT